MCDDECLQLTCEYVDWNLYSKCEWCNCRKACMGERCKS